MPARLALSLLVILAVPALAQQQSSIQNRISQHVDALEQRTSQVITAPGPDLKAARTQALCQDARQLSALSQSVQYDLRQLQKGLLVKDLNDNLKKMEKLSKKVRREMQ